MSIASELNNYRNGLDDAWDAAADMGATIPTDRNMVNLDDAIRTIPVSSPNNGVLTITQNGVTIQTFSADQATNATAALTDTTYSDFTGATSLVAGAHGLVPAPAAGDDTKFLAGDGTWKTVGSGSNLTILYADDIIGSLWDNKLYTDAGHTHAVTHSEFHSIVESCELGIYDEDGDEVYLMVEASGNYAFFIDGGRDGFSISIDSSDQTHLLYVVESTTWKEFTGATSSQNGSNGLVPAPTTSDPDKFLKGDGTWGTPTDTTYTAGTNVQISAQNVISATDTTYSDFTGATASVAGAHGLVPAPSAGDEGKALHGDGTWKDTTAKLVEMSYGESSAWAKFIAAYNAGSIVYCRASSNANPGTGSQTRKAFMAYVNNATSPTSVEFQYVRSNSSKSDSSQCDQVFVYTLKNTSGGTWSVATRDMAPKINVSGPITKTFTSGANATVTIGADAMTGATSGVAGTAGIVPAPAAGDQDKVLSGAGTWVVQSGGNPTVTTEHTTASGWFAPTWYKREYPDGRIIYTYTGQSITLTFTGDQWIWDTITTPVTFDATKMSASINVRAGDAAITTCAAIDDGSTFFYVGAQNKYAGNVSTVLSTNVRIEVFPN